MGTMVDTAAAAAKLGVNLQRTNALFGVNPTVLRTTDTNPVWSKNSNRLKRHEFQGGSRGVYLALWGRQ